MSGLSAIKCQTSVKRNISFGFVFKLYMPGFLFFCSSPTFLWTFNLHCGVDLPYSGREMVSATVSKRDSEM